LTSSADYAVAKEKLQAEGIAVFYQVDTRASFEDVCSEIVSWQLSFLKLRSDDIMLRLDKLKMEKASNFTSRDLNAWK
jgi:hypothetical protein